MSFISDQIKDSGMYDYLVEQVIDELEALEKQEGELKDRVKQLEQELAEAKKDQARYQWLRSQNWNQSNLCVVTRPKLNVKLGAVCPNLDRLDQAIDAAIKESK